MDHYLLSAEGMDRKGSTGVFRLQVSERDSECTSRDEWALRLLMAAQRCGVVLTGEMRVEDGPMRGQRVPQSETPPGKGDKPK